MKLKLFSIIFFLSINFCFAANQIGQSVADSNSDFAQTLKMVVKDLIGQEKTEEEIYHFLSEKYGDWILYKPKFNLENFFLWFFPYFVLIIGGFIIVFLIKKRSKKV